MDRMNGAEAAVRMLQHHGVRHIFGLCGDTSLPFYDALCVLDHARACPSMMRCACSITV